MNKYRIYLNNNDLTDSVDISADYPQVMGNIIIFYIGDEVVASIPPALVFIRLPKED
jgi:hypothetical protein